VLIAIKGIATGRVQGVGFRYFTQQQATMLDLHGYVKNLDDGSVEFFAQGEAQAVSAFCAKLKVGPRFSNVAAFDYETVALERDLDGFQVRH